MNTSYWIDKQQGKHYSPLSEDKQIHTLIIGAGLSGLTTAYYLSQVTSNVMVIEADEIGYGASGRNTGKITFQHGLVYKKLISAHGEAAAKAYYLAQKEAIESIKAIVSEHDIDCDFQEKDALLYTTDETKLATLQDEYQAYLDLGIPAQFVEKCYDPFPIVAGIKVSHQAGFDPYRYQLGLSDYLDVAGISIYEHSSAESIEKDGSGWRVSVNGHTVHAQNIVSATQTPMMDAFSFFYAKTYPSISHLAILETAQAKLDDMMFSIDDPMSSYHGLSDTTLLCGGYEHPCGEETKQDLDAWIMSLQKTWDTPSPSYVWSTQDLVSFDHLPMIGPISKACPNFFIACGFSKWGNTNSNVAAKIISSMILKQENVYASLFDPNRISSFLQPKCFRMNLRTAKNFLKSQFPQVSSMECGIKEGKQIELDHRLYGMYCDEQEDLYIVDIRCPHMGCICSFNEVDHTWDCPCHGSRFSYDGSIIKGPAQDALHTYDSGEKNHVDPHEFISKHHD